MGSRFRGYLPAGVWAWPAAPGPPRGFQVSAFRVFSCLGHFLFFTAFPITAKQPKRKLVELSKDEKNWLAGGGWWGGGAAEPILGKGRDSVAGENSPPPPLHNPQPLPPHIPGLIHCFATNSTQSSPKLLLLLGASKEGWVQSGPPHGLTRSRPIGLSTPAPLLFGGWGAAHSR